MTKRMFGFLLSLLLALGLLGGCKATSAHTLAGNETLAPPPGVWVSTFASTGEHTTDPSGLAIDKAGNLYVADFGNSRIHTITPQGEVSTLAQSQAPHGYNRIAVDAKGNLYVTDSTGHSIRKITPQGEISTLAGSGKEGFADGPGSQAQFAFPVGIAVDAKGFLYVADRRNHRIRTISPAGVVSTLAGSSTAGFADGPGSQAQFEWPLGIAADKAGNLYVAEANNHRIRTLSPAGVVSTLAGSGEAGFADGPGGEAKFAFPSDIAVDAKGNLYVADANNHRIRKITPQGLVSTLAGGGETGEEAGGFADGPGSEARFNRPSRIAIDSKGNLYVMDFGNNQIRKLVMSVPSK